MGTGTSIEARGTPRRESTPPARETQRRSTAEEEAGKTIADLDEYSKIDLEEYEEYLKIDFEAYSASEKNNNEKVDLFADENLALDGPKFRTVGAGPFKSFRCSSDVPYDDAAKRGELKLWILEKLSQNDVWHRYTLKYKREPGGGVGIKFSPLGSGALKEDEIQRLKQWVVQAEQNVMTPVIAKSNPKQSEKSIFASWVIFNNKPYMKIHNIPRNSRLPKLMAQITYAIHKEVYKNCRGHVFRFGRAFFLYRITPSGEFKLKNINSQKFETALLDSLMNHLTKLQDQGYDIHKRSIEQKIFEELLGAVKNDLSSTFQVDFA